MGDHVAKSRIRGKSPAAQPLSSHLICGIRAHFLRTSRVPAGDEAGIDALGLLDPAALFLPVALDAVGVRGSLLAARSLASGLEFHITQLLGVEGWPRPGAALALCEQMSDQDSEFACVRHGGDMLAAACAQTQEEGAQWPRRTGRCPRRLDEHAAGMATTLHPGWAHHKAIPKEEQQDE